MSKPKNILRQDSSGRFWLVVTKREIAVLRFLLKCVLDGDGRAHESMNLTRRIFNKVRAADNECKRLEEQKKETMRHFEKR